MMKGHLSINVGEPIRLLFSYKALDKRERRNGMINFVAKKYVNMKDVVLYTSSSLTLALGSFLAESLIEISVWFVVMLVVIIADLCAGIYKVLNNGDHFRLSKGLRDTMGKIVVYFAFVVAAVFVGQASGIESLSKWCCLVVIAGEGLSIASNLLKAHGYNLNIKTVIKMLQKKASLETDEALVSKVKETKKSKSK